jgi:hypothetical protein
MKMMKMKMKMKKIKTFKQYERLSENDINKLLDKISKDGYDNLSDVDKRKLKHANDDEEYELLEGERKEYIINVLKNTVAHEYDGFIALYTLGVESVIYDENKNIYHIIDALTYDGVEISIYDYDLADVTSTYSMKYNELPEDVLEEIYNIL